LIGRLALSFLLGGTTALFAQAIPTASRIADVQIGVGYTLANPGYFPQNFQGGGIYGDFDFRPHLGVEAELHQVYSTNGDRSYERTYDIGGRYFRTYGPLVPYVKGMIGRGDFNYPFGQTNLGYTMYTAGAGADFKFGPYLRARGEYEFQKWAGFTNGTLTPQLITIGIAYHFAGKSD
jgi:hypothetical protein